MSSELNTEYFSFILYDGVDGNSVRIKNMDYIYSRISIDPDPFHIIPYYSKDISEIDDADGKEFWVEHNIRELNRANKLLENVKRRLKKIPASQEYNLQKDYCENVIGEFLSWFEQHGINPDATSSSYGIITPTKQPKKKTRPKDPNREENIQKLHKRYYELNNQQGLKKDKCLDILEEEFSDWTRSTIDSYLKK